MVLRYSVITLSFFSCALINASCNDDWKMNASPDRIQQVTELQKKVDALGNVGDWTFQGIIDGTKADRAKMLQKGFYITARDTKCPMIVIRLNIADAPTYLVNEDAGFIVFLYEKFG